MTLALTPNAEKVIADHLRGHPDVAAITTSVANLTPKSTDSPWIRYTQLDKRSVGGHRSDYLIEAYIQIECYAGKTGGQPEASRLARTVRAVLVDMPNASVTGAVVTGVDIRGDSRQPDRDLDSRERFILTAYVWMHG